MAYFNTTDGAALQAATSLLSQGADRGGRVREERRRFVVQWHTWHHRVSTILDFYHTLAHATPTPRQVGRRAEVVVIGVREGGGRGSAPRQLNRQMMPASWFETDEPYCMRGPGCQGRLEAPPDMPVDEPPWKKTARRRNMPRLSVITTPHGQRHGRRSVDATAAAGAGPKVVTPGGAYAMVGAVRRTPRHGRSTCLRNCMSRRGGR